MDKIYKFLKDKGYNKIVNILKFKEYTCYEVVNRESFGLIIGLPTYLLVNEKEMRFASEDEVFEIMDSEREEDINYEIYSRGNLIGYLLENELYDEYREKIDKGLIILDDEYSAEELEDIIETLKLSLENGEDFYKNAKPYMKRRKAEIENLIKE